MMPIAVYITFISDERDMTALKTFSVTFTTSATLIELTGTLCGRNSVDKSNQPLLDGTRFPQRPWVLFRC